MNKPPAANNGMTAEQAKMLNQRFRNKKDLYDYM